MKNGMTITLEEVRDLVKQIVIRDQRFGVEFDLAAWFQDLNYAQVSYQAALEALVHYYTKVWPEQPPEQRFRATAPELIAIVRKQRRERLAETEFVYVPGDPDEPTPVYLARLRSQIAAVADGNPVPEIARLVRSRPVKELVSGLVPKTVIPEEIRKGLGRRRHPALAYMCPKCGTPAQKLCVRDDGKPLEYRTHPSRVDVWAIETVGCPQCRAGAGQGCRDSNLNPYPHGAHTPRVQEAEKEEQ